MNCRTYFSALIALPLALSIVGCGYSEEEWQAQLDKYGRLQGEHQATEAKLAQTSKDLDAERARVAKLEKELQDAGVDISNLSSNLDQTKSTLEEQAKALREYKARAAQLEQIKARFEALKQKLDALTKLGLNVNIRKNRMVISLPGDVLFDSGKVTLKKDGEDILSKVAAVINGDASLRARDYQVAGHTDNKPFTGAYKDNWGLSLMRAREVLTFLISDKEGKLPVAHWSAAGFAATDPIASNDTDDGRQKNRRCELIVVPSVEEMLDLKAIAN